MTYHLPSQPTTKLFIDGKFVESKTSEWLDIHNPVSISNGLARLKLHHFSTESMYVAGLRVQSVELLNLLHNV